MLTSTISPPAQSAIRQLLHLTRNHPWFLGALTLVGFTITLAPTPPGDFWWHLKADQIIAAQGIPHANLFAWTLPPDQPYVYGEWLAEWLTMGCTRLVVWPRPCWRATCSLWPRSA